MATNGDLSNGEYLAFMERAYDKGWGFARSQELWWWLQCRAEGRERRASYERRMAPKRLAADDWRGLEHMFKRPRVYAGPPRPYAEHLPPALLTDEELFRIVHDPRCQPFTKEFDWEVAARASIARQVLDARNAGRSEQRAPVGRRA